MGNHGIFWNESTLQGTTVLMATYNSQLGKYCASPRIAIENGRVVRDGSKRRIRIR